MSEEVTNFDIQFLLEPGELPPLATRIRGRGPARWQIDGYPGVVFRRRGPARNNGVVTLPKAIGRSYNLYYYSPPQSSDVLGRHATKAGYYQCSIFYQMRD